MIFSRKQQPTPPPSIYPLWEDIPQDPTYTEWRECRKTIYNNRTYWLHICPHFPDGILIGSDDEGNPNYDWHIIVPLEDLEGTLKYLPSLLLSAEL